MLHIESLIQSYIKLFLFAQQFYCIVVFCRNYNTQYCCYVMEMHFSFNPFQKKLIQMQYSECPVYIRSSHSIPFFFSSLYYVKIVHSIHQIEQKMKQNNEWTIEHLRHKKTWKDSYLVFSWCDKFSQTKSFHWFFLPFLPWTYQATDETNSLRIGCSIKNLIVFCISTFCSFFFRHACDFLHLIRLTLLKFFVFI